MSDDDGGHLIASMFKGSGDIDNPVAMNQSINRNGGEWYNMEMQWREALNEVPPKKVSVSIEPIYGSSSVRPDAFKVNYSIGNNRVRELTIVNEIGG